MWCHSATHCQSHLLQCSLILVDDNTMLKEFLLILGSLKYHNGDGHEKVTWEVNSRSINLYHDNSYPLTLPNSSGAEFSRTNIHVQKEKENFLITSSTKREIRKFYIIVVQWQQRNVQKAYCTCKVVVLPIQPIAFCTFPIVVAILIGLQHPINR